MKTLLYMEFREHFYASLAIIICSVFAGVFDSTLFNWSLIWIILARLHTYSISKEEKGRYKLNLTLPVSRKQIVLCEYIFLFSHILFALILNIIVGTIFGKAGVGKLSMSFAGFYSIIAMFSYLIIIPYKFQYRSSTHNTLINMIVIFPALVVIFLLANIKSIFIRVVLVTVLWLLGLVISFKKSLKYAKEKDF